MRNWITWVLVAVVLAFGLVYYFAVVPKSGSSLDPDVVDFAVPDTQSIEQIRLRSYRNGELRRTIELERTRQGWLLNGQYRVNKSRLQALLETLVRVEYKESLPPKGQENVLKYLKEEHILVEVEHAGGNKTYYVGSGNALLNGNYMLMKGEEQPVVTHIPGFNGYLKPRYTTHFNEWRENLLFHAEPGQLQAFTVQYSNPDSSFTLIPAEDGRSWKLKSGERVDTFMTNAFMRKLQTTYAQSFLTETYPNALDSLRKLQPDVVLGIRYKSGDLVEVPLWRTPHKEGFYWSITQHGGKTELVEVQEFALRNYLRTRRFFFPPKY